MNEEEIISDFSNVINNHCLENLCDIPDFILAEMILSFIKSVGPHVKQTLDWHGCDSVCHPKPSEEPIEL